jgi:hypothetical protein
MRLPDRYLRDYGDGLMRPPPGFSWAPGGLHRRGVGYALGRGPTSFLLDAGADYYVDPARPNDAGNGLTPATAKRNWWAALNALPFPDVGPVNVWIKSGTYNLSAGWSGGGAGITVLSRANIIATANLNTATLASWEPGIARTTIAPTLTWALETGATYKAALAAAPYAVVDELELTYAGVGTRLTLQASIAAVDAAPGSYHWAGGFLYVRTDDGRAPDASVHAFKDAQINGRANLADVSIYADGIEFLGGNLGAMAVVAGADLTFNRCAFRYGKYAGLDANASANVRLFDSDADQNGADGIDYTTVLRAIESRCRGRSNGHGGTNLDNATSMHSGGSIIRTDCEYIDSQGVNVGDVGGGKTLMLGCTVQGTRSGDNSRKVNVWIGDGGNAYLERCRLSGNDVDVRADGATDVINLYSTPIASSGGAGVVRVSRG